MWRIPSHPNPHFSRFDKFPYPHPSEWWWIMYFFIVLLLSSYGQQFSFCGGFSMGDAGNTGATFECLEFEFQT